MRYFVPILVALTFLLSTLLVRSESLTVSLVVGVTEVTFSGYTSPLAQIVIKEDGGVIGTTTSDSSGNWSKTVSIALPGLHTYELYGTDSSSRTTATISYNLSVVGNTTTTIDNIVLPPTAELSGTNLIGSSYPGSTITITFSSGETPSLVVPASGNWSYDLTTHTSSATITVTATVGSFLSLQSTSLSYVAPTPTPSQTPSPSTSPSSSSTTASASPSPSSSITPSVSPSPSPTPTPFFIPLYDQNQDGKLGIGELFDVITSWLKHHLPCDLNRDQKCNLIDLSILLYYFER